MKSRYTTGRIFADLRFGRLLAQLQTGSFVRWRTGATPCERRVRQRAATAMPGPGTRAGFFVSVSQSDPQERRGQAVAVAGVSRALRLGRSL